MLCSVGERAFFESSGTIIAGSLVNVIIKWLWIYTSYQPTTIGKNLRVYSFVWGVAATSYTELSWMRIKGKADWQLNWGHADSNHLNMQHKIDSFSSVKYPLFSVSKGMIKLCDLSAAIPLKLTHSCMKAFSLFQGYIVTSKESARQIAGSKISLSKHNTQDKRNLHFCNLKYRMSQTLVKRS